MGAPNIKVVRARKTREIVRLNLIRQAADSEAPGVAARGDLKYTYEESPAQRPLVVLKRFDPETGRFVKWSDDDAFNPFRFNPDALPVIVAK
jgi:hypothetical protein